MRFPRKDPMRTRSCTNHCRGCERHFTSLEAFDAHRSNSQCLAPADAPLVELAGACAIGDPENPQSRQKLWEHERAQAVRDYHQAENVRESVSTDGKSALL